MGVVNDLVRPVNDLAEGVNDLIGGVNDLFQSVNRTSPVRNALAGPVNAFFLRQNHYGHEKWHFFRFITVFNG